MWVGYLSDPQFRLSGFENFPVFTTQVTSTGWSWVTE
jgi:hypothetical protein